MRNRSAPLIARYAGAIPAGGEGEARVRTTVHDVANAAGVSVSTVSRALTGGRVSPATRETVLEAAERLGYRPNRAAQGLITGRTGNLGLIVPDLRNPFFADVLDGTLEQFEADGYELVTAACCNDEAGRPAPWRPCSTAAWTA